MEERYEEKRVSENFLTTSSVLLDEDEEDTEENTENKTNIKPKGFLEKLTERVKEFLENAE